MTLREQLLRRVAAWCLKEATRIHYERVRALYPEVFKK